jgi:hypothetical protein
MNRYHGTRLDEDGNKYLTPARSALPRRPVPFVLAKDRLKRESTIFAGRNEAEQISAIHPADAPDSPNGPEKMKNLSAIFHALEAQDSDAR